MKFFLTLLPLRSEDSWKSFIFTVICLSFRKPKVTDIRVPAKLTRKREALLTEQSARTVRRSSHEKSSMQYGSKHNPEQPGT